MQKKRVWIGGIVAVIVIGTGVGIAIMARQTATPLPSTDSMDREKHAPTTESGSALYRQFAALKGEAYDKAFIGDMIVHHEGAVNMAELAMAQASHQEIKDLAATIVSSQSKEIADMKQWQQNWGYPVSSGHGMHGGSSGGMQEDMAAMGTELQTLSGDAFDRKFLDLMIEHHQQAIDMAKPADTNAQHAEVKDIAKIIIAAQTKEIETMEQWQKEWWQ
ncbi:DUF305 domain-containing protein [Streptomyces caniscabiei]|uniref:DUF305 domain-containing protein n=1 Tax=Streptomyces caniscabiei TaxID=2746961 RepID=UPI0029BF453D|nr:DUF305 domain-containing protein [Streptomyces caniscabiei]MDX2775789.1 DUF305 domain-containing protein [Streptomyces caniscabiei]